MKDLLSTDSIKYKRRLVRELNFQEHGFYAPVACHNLRCNRARIKNNVFECRSPSGSPMWFEPSKMIFEDCYGREIVASRK